MFKDENRHYGLRKLSVGLASVLIGISFASSMNGSSVKADTVKSGSNGVQTVVKGSDAAIKIDAKDDANAIESNTESAPEASKKNPNAIAQDIKQKAMKASEAVTKMQGTAEKITKGNAPEGAVTNATDGGQATAESTLKGTNLIAKQQNTAVKDNADAGKDDSSNVAEKDSLTAKNNALKAKVEAAKQGLETPAVQHSDGNETTLNVKGSNAITENMLKEDKDNQAGADPAKSKLKLAALLTTTGKKLNAQMLSASKVMAPTKDTNGGFDEATWGKLNVNNWKGSVQGDYYQLTDYTGDANHVIVPNEADFAKVGISTSGKQVGVTSDLMHTIFKDNSADTNVTIAFSKTDNKMVKAIDSNWSGTWNPYENFVSISATLSKFDGTNLDVSNVTNMSQMFYGSQISDLSSLANWKVNNVTNMDSMFEQNYISDLSPLANWKVDNVKDMSSMFQLNKISDLRPLANWKVDNVTNMGDMFGQNQISDLRPLANWKVDNVTNMGDMFGQNQISDLSSLANWKVDNVTNMGDMFGQNQISDLSSLASWHTDNVTDMSKMFDQNQIKDLSPLASWHTDNVTDMSSMFDQNQIKDLSPLANWKVDNVGRMGFMFASNQISDLSPLTNWNVNNVGEMYWTFAGNKISNLSPLANWKVDNVQIMGSMFEQNQISDLSPLAGWNTNNVTDMSRMFYGNHISDISPLANWNVNSVDYMSSMFDNNSLIITQAKRVINFVYPTGYTGKKQDSVTQTVDLPQKVKIELTTKDPKLSNNILDWVTKTETPETPAPVYFQDYTVPEIQGLLEPDQTVISREQADITKPINVTVTYKLVDSNTNDAYALDSKNGLHEHANVNDNGGYDKDYWGKINVDDWNYTVNGDRIEITGLKDGISIGANDAVIVPNLDDFKLAGKDGGAKTVYISNSTLGETAKHKYYGLSKTNGNTFATNSDISNAFDDNSNLTHADLNSLDTSNVTDMHNMFSSTSSLTSLDVSNWDTSNVTNMSNMFSSTSSLTSLDVSNWDTSNVTDMSVMFSGASSLTSLDVSNWDTSNVTHMNFMFYSDSSLTSLDVSNWDTGKVTSMIYMFNSASSLTSLDVSNWDTSNVTHMNGLFDGASSLTNLDVSKWKTGNVTDMNDMFDGASSLTSLDVSKWDTGNVTTMSEMFEDASSLTSLDVSNWNTSKVTDMNWMFGGASNLTTLDVSNWDTSKVTAMSYMFYNASNLTTLDVSNWDTSKVTAMGYMFYGASNLTTLDVSNWNTGNVTDMNWMFYGASNLTTLDVSNWDTSKVTAMSGMFYGASGLTSLDVSNWKTGNVTDMSGMFSGASSLALLVNGDKFTDYLVKHNFAKSRINSDVKSVTTDNTKLLQLLTNDAQHNSATKTIVFTFPVNYSPDLAKYHLIKVGNTYQIKQSADYDKPYLQGTVLINGTGDITEHRIDTTEQYKLSDTWQPNYDKLVLAHKNSDGSVSFDDIQLPQIPGYKTVVKTVASPVNPARARFAVSFMALPKPAETVSPATPVAIEVAKPIKTEPKVTTPAAKVIDLSDDAVVTTPDVSAWKVANEPNQDTYQVSNGKYTVELPHISNAQLHVIANDSTKDSILFTYKGQNNKYVFKIKFANGHYLLTTYKIKSGKLVKLIDYNFVKSSKMIDIILDWINLK